MMRHRPFPACRSSHHRCGGRHHAIPRPAERDLISSTRGSARLRDMYGRRTFGDAGDRVLRDGGQRADVPVEADQGDRAIHAGLPGRRAGPRRHPAGIGTPGAEHRDRQPSRRRHHHRHQAGRHRRPRRLHAADRRYQFRAVILALSESRLRSGQELRAGGDAGLQPAGAGDRTVGAGHHRAGIRDLREGQSGPAQFRFRSGHPAADPGRVVQGGHRYRHRQHPLQGRCAGHHRYARRPHPDEFRDHGDAAAADPAGQGPGAGGHHPGAEQGLA